MKKAAARLFRLLFPPDCAECGAYQYGRMHGNYWHKDTCPWPTRLRDADDE